MTNTNKKVMIVEDDEHISKVYKVIFAGENITASFAVDGEEAVIKIKDEKPDVILLDLMLPKKDGFSVLEDIKKIPSLAKIPVIVLSNLGKKTDQERALALGATEYLIKVDHPIQDIVEKVKGYLG